MEEIILASGSPRRKEILKLIGVPFRVCKSNAAENRTQTRPDLIVEELSLLKAEAVARQEDHGVILGADTIVWHEGQVLGKPADRESARQMLQSLQGKIHSVYTGVTLIRRDYAKTVRTLTFHSRTDVHVHSMTSEEIERYIDTGEPFDKAGAYGIQGPFAAYVDRIEGDYMTVVGLPAAMVWQKLKEI